MGEIPITRIGSYTKGQFPGDPDIAGIGILAVFVAVTSLAIITGTVSIIWKLAKRFHWKTTYSEKQKKQRQHNTSFSDVLETLVLACSDQQVFTGAAFALTLRYWRGCTISAYHYNIVANMMLLTCATHLISVTIVRNYWKFPWLAALRVLSITAVFAVTGLLMTNQNADVKMPFPTSIPYANETESPIFLPAACFQGGNDTIIDTIEETTSNAHAFFKNNISQSTSRIKIQGWNLYIIILLFYGAAIIAELVRLIRRSKSRPGWRGRVGNQFRKCGSLGTTARKISQWVSTIYLLAGIILSYGVTVISARYIFELRKWVDRSGWIALQNNENPENDAKSFGQMVPILSSALIVFSFAQIVSEKCRKHNDRKHSDEEMPSQVGTVEYFGSSRYNMVPQSVPEKYKAMHYRSMEVSADSLPPQVSFENQSPWGGSMNSSGTVATPLLSGSPYSSTSGTLGIQQPMMKDSRHSILPDRPTPKSRSLIGSSNPSLESMPRPVGRPANFDGLWVQLS
ncbi:hypothetical protein F5Y00DRAFT_271966 [Daldinia vernicosa]|uniref:uncharacterized protein n=1 Tax=Daldinia vernicosa TaxID=114800 RepID=UPI0020082C2F|nr:uncharacterized protein F5Y00DRAFT_271966 [Daldinia vernicosa]KAI0846511.1 hypothetical protein F5Y00DRAFT_271966 [Daldinia vernicosa]